jgi:uncharacterized OB-fold protein
MSQKIEFENILRRIEEISENSKKIYGAPLIIDPKTGVATWYDQREIKIRFLISIEKIKRFFEALSRGKILATKCVNTGEIMFPPQINCPRDPKNQIEWVEISNEGKLVTWTIIKVKPYSFSHHDDYIVGIAKISNLNINILAWVKCKDPNKLRPGLRVRLNIVKREPENYLIYQLEPLEEC